MSNINVANIVNPTTADSTPTYNLSKQVCKAWVNFDGTGVPTIRDSYNVASITDDGTGKYTVNFSTPMSDTNYMVSVTGNNTGLMGYLYSGCYAGGGVYTTSSANIEYVNGNGNAASEANFYHADSTYVGMAIFGS